MDDVGDGNEGPDAIWRRSTDDPDPPEENDEPWGGRLRRRAREANRQEAPSTAPLITPPPPRPAPTEENDGAGDYSPGSTEATPRGESLVDAVAALRADMEKNFADVTTALVRGQEQTTHEVNDAVARSVEATRSELVTRFKNDLEDLTNTVSAALTQVATQLERVSLLCGENRDSVEATAKQLQDISGRLDATAPPPPPDLQPLSEAFTRLADRVEALTRRVG